MGHLFLLLVSLAPFVIRWMDESDFAELRRPPPMASSSRWRRSDISGCRRRIIGCNGPDSVLAAAIGDDRKGKLSLALYILAIPLAFASPWLSIAIYVGIAALWFVPDKRIEHFARDEGPY